MVRKTLRSRSVSKSRKSSTSASVSSTSASTTEPAPPFQLTDLNNDCLIHVFEFLDLPSLKHMCEIDERFHDIITTHIVPYRTIEFDPTNDQESTRNTFSMFGKSMTRIAVHNHDDTRPSHMQHSTFLTFLVFLMKYCEPGRLKEVNIAFGRHDRSVPNEILAEIRSYFSNVHTLHVNLKNRTTGYLFSSLMDAIDTRNIRSLRVENCYWIGTWLKVDAFPNLRKLCINLVSQYDSINGLVRFITAKPASLMEFHCANVDSNVIEELSRHLPNIERIGEVPCWWDNETFNRNRYEPRRNLNNYKSNWKYFNAFANLKWVNLKSSTIDFSDSGEAFSILAKRNTIEELHLTFGLTSMAQDTNVVKVADLQQLTQLKTLQLHNFDEKYSKEFANTLMANLPALTACVIRGKRISQTYITETVKLARHLMVLKLECKVTAFSATFYKKLVKCRQSAIGGQGGGGNGEEENPLVIHIDAAIGQDVLEQLGPQYKPSIVMIQSI